MAPPVKHSADSPGNKENEADAPQQPPSGDVVRKNIETLTAAVLAALESPKGQIKETELKPLLTRYKFKEFHDNLRAMNQFLDNTFGKTLVQDPITRSFYLRNNLFEESIPLRETLATGLLNHKRVDDGFISFGPVDAQKILKRNHDMTTIFAVLTSIMMSNNIELPHSEWELVDDQLQLLMLSLGLDEKASQAMLKSFAKDGWIRVSQEEGNNQLITVNYHWGPRAIATVRTRLLFEKYCIATNQAKHEWGNYEEVFRKKDERTFH
uniref:MAGE domain-containing protein n=1 Tax=Panagrellus redivivus TaxID=6233 RepID=A0A7E5A1X3_PANRE